MNASGTIGAVGEINRLHAEVTRLAEESDKALHAALGAAWQAGQLLRVEKKRVRKTMGGAWLPWLEANFRGSVRTAQNYMRLAESVTDVTQLRGMSLRQAYIQLGISTAPKCGHTDAIPVRSLPAHVRFATRLVRALKESNLPRLAPERVAAYRQDLRPLYEQLRRLFEPNQTLRRQSN